MYFADFTQLWLMDGHGAYVWSAYAIVIVVLAALVYLPLARRRRALERVRSRLRVSRPLSKRE